MKQFISALFSIPLLWLSVDSGVCAPLVSVDRALTRAANQYGDRGDYLDSAAQNDLRARIVETVKKRNISPQSPQAGVLDQQIDQFSTLLSDAHEGSPSKMITIEEYEKAKKDSCSDCPNWLFPCDCPPD